MSAESCSAGFDDIQTTLHVPVSEIVEEGVRLAIQLARDPTAAREPTVTLRAPSLIVRQSTAVPPG